MVRLPRTYTPKELPHFVHNCPYCKFLGSWAWRGVLWDLYFCRQGSLNLPDVIARYSSEPDDFQSGLDTAAEIKKHPQVLDQLNDPLVRAMDMALSRGLLKDKEIP
jgi:hypothetical protein